MSGGFVLPAVVKTVPVSQVPLPKPRPTEYIPEQAFDVGFVKETVGLEKINEQWDGLMNSLVNLSIYDVGFNLFLIGLVGAGVIAFGYLGFSLGSYLYKKYYQYF